MNLLLQITFIVCLLAFEQLQSDSQINELEFREVEMKCRYVRDDTYVIKNQTQLKLEVDKRNDGVCSSYDFPNIDFDTYVLLGYDLHVGGCDIPTYAPKVYNLEDKTVVELSIDVKGKCIRGNLITFWCLVKKEVVKSKLDFNFIES
jgi:hypothetical protein